MEQRAAGLKVDFVNYYRPTGAQVAQHEVPKGNRLLAALSDTDWQRWRRQLEFVDLRMGQPLVEPGEPPRHAYFPITGVVSLKNLCSCGKLTQTAVVGSEGVVGISLILGGHSTNSCALVAIPGQGVRMGARAFQDGFNQSEALRRILLRYVMAVTAQISQTAVCNRHHSVEQQLCGWLLHSLDRMPGSEVVVTQELIAGMLGVRRESVTEAAGRMHEAGLIHRSRGLISVLDRVGLERRSCECHAVVKKEYDRQLPWEPVALPADPGRQRWLASAPGALAYRRPRSQGAAMHQA